MSSHFVAGLERDRAAHSSSCFVAERHSALVTEKDLLSIRHARALWRELPASGTYEMMYVCNHKICYLHRLLKNEEEKPQCVPYPDMAQSLSVKPNTLQPQTSAEPSKLCPQWMLLQDVLFCLCSLFTPLIYGLSHQNVIRMVLI